MSDYQSIEVTIKGLCPCIMNNGRKANPMDPYVKAMKEITSNRGRGKVLTDELANELQRLEFMASLYVNEDGAPCWPGENIEAMLRAAAKKQRRGKDVESGLFVPDGAVFEYDGPRDPEKLFANPSFRKTCMARNKGVPVLKCRPMFSQWTLTFIVNFDPEIITPAAIESWLKIAGTQIGLSDWRPRFGRFEVKSIEAC